MNWATLVNAANLSDAELRCTPDTLAESCQISEAENGRRDALAGVRVIICSLSILGTFTIIYSAIRRKQVCSPKVHPIFVLSIADMMLGALWFAGGLLWLRRSTSVRRSWCLAASLLTVILECVTINLTLVYALLAYSTIKKLDKSRVVVDKQTSGLDQDDNNPSGNNYCSVWRVWKSTLVYSIAWLLPIVLVMVPFTFIVTIGDFRLLDHVINCTCWCKPTFGNVLPTVAPNTNVTAAYYHELRKLLLLYGTVLTGHYFVVFILLVTCYWKLLKFIANHKKELHEKNYGAIKVQIIERAQSRTKRRVIYFIGIFILSGFFNFILSLMFMLHESRSLILEDHILKEIRKHPTDEPPVFVMIIYHLQSVTVPLQGFLNAIVYGWTREDFVNAVTSKESKNEEEDDAETHQNGALGRWSSVPGSQQALSVTVQEQNGDPPYIETEFENSDEEDSIEIRRFIGSSGGSESEEDFDMSIHRV